MTTANGALLLVVWIPLLVVWAVVVADVLRRTDLGTTGKALWIGLCTLLWPMLIAYLMLRPPRGRLETAEGRTDPRARLVDAALLHEDGVISDADMASLVRGLRSPQASSG